MALQTTDWHISKAQKNCFKCQKLFETGEVMHSCVEEDAATFQLIRQDYCIDCWPNSDKQKSTTHWKTIKTAEINKKTITVDNDVLFNLFERLKDSESQRNRSYAYLLSLILMRKRVLIFEDVRITDGVEYMIMSKRPKQENDSEVSVIDPHLSIEEINSLNEDLNRLISIGEFSAESSQ